MFKVGLGFGVLSRYAMVLCSYLYKLAFDVYAYTFDM